MKRKGYTLIELIVVLSIMSILSTLAIGGGMYFKDKGEVLTFENSIYEVKSLLSFAKSYCRKNKIEGDILIDKNGESITFNVNNKNHGIIKKITLNKDIKVGSNFKSGINKINKEGFITGAGTITLNYKNIKVVKITISVGNDIIRVNDNDENEGDIIDWKKVVL